MRLVYACRFDVRSSRGLDEVADSYRDWITRYYRDRLKLLGFSFDPKQPGVSTVVPTGHQLEVAAVASDAGSAIRIRWSYPDDDDKWLRWFSEVRVGQFGEMCGVEHLVSTESAEYNVAPVRVQFGSPRVVRDICARTPAHIGDMQVKATPYFLNQGQYEDFLALLTSDLRRLPVVVLSPYADGAPNVVDAERLARNLAGVAVVVPVTDPEVAWDFADDFDRQLSCFNGAARIYWPGFSRESDPRTHRLFFGAWIEEAGGGVASRAIERAIFAVASFRFVPDHRISEVFRAAETAERQKLLAEKRAAGDDFWEDYERDLARLDEATEKIRELEAENANLRSNQQVFVAGVVTPVEGGEGEVGAPAISSVREAVRYADGRLKNVEFLPSAHESADDSPFQRPYDVWEAIRDLDEIVDAWRIQRDAKGSGGDLIQHLRARGWGKRSSLRISDTTRGKFRSDYEFEYNGQKQLFEPHITIGAGDPNSCASVHFIFDQQREKIVIAHVGKHLPNTKS